MPIYAIIFTFVFSLMFTACQSTPDVPLSPELDKYALVQEKCEGLRTIPGIHVPDALDKECRNFLRRLDKANALEYKVAHFNDDRDPSAKPKPEFIMLQTDAYRQRRKTEVEYETFCDTINKTSLDAITHNELSNVELTLTFAETTFTKEHYDYYKKQTAKHHAEPQFIIFEKRYAKELIKQGLDYLSQGDKKHAIAAFKEASSLNNVKAAYLVGIVYEAKNIDKAIQWHTKAKEDGITRSRIHLARLYERKRQPKEAQKLYVEAAEDGDAYAQFQLYRQYKRTDNVKTNALSQKWLIRSAESAFPPAEYAYGQQLLKAKKTESAKSWLTKAYEHGISMADIELGTLYFNDKNYAEALKHLTAAQSGKSKYQLAQMYEKGLGVKIDYYRSYLLYGEAVRLGQKKAKKDAARLSKLKTAKEQAHYDAAKRKEKQRQEAFVLNNGQKPILRNIRTKGMSIHIRGLVTLPLGNSSSFIVHGEGGRHFYILDPEHQLDVSQYQHVDIVTTATGNAITVSSDEGMTTDIYYFTFQKHCQH